MEALTNNIFNKTQDTVNPLKQAKLQLGPQWLASSLLLLETLQRKCTVKKKNSHHLLTAD